MAIRPIVLAATLAVAALGTTTVTAQVYKETVSGHNGGVCGFLCLARVYG